MEIAGNISFQNMNSNILKKIELRIAESICWLTVAFLAYNNLMVFDYVQQFWLLTIAVVVQNLFEFRKLYRNDPRHFFLKPVVLGAIIVFFLQHGGITNFIYKDLDGSFYQPYNTYLNREPFWLVRTMALVLGSSVLYWFGYHLSVGSTLGHKYFKTYSRFWNFKVSEQKLLIGLVIGIIVKLILNYYGALGHRFGLVVADSGSFPGFIYRIKLLENLSFLFVICFMFLALQYKRNAFYWAIFIFALSFEILFSLTTGNRNMFVFVFIGIFLVDYYFRGHLKIAWVVAGAATLIFAMTILENFKTYAFRAREAAMTKDPVEYIQNAMVYNDKLKKHVSQDKDLEHLIYLKTIGRFTYVNEATQVMRYKQVEGLKATDPDFLAPFFTFPFFAVVPQYWVLGKEMEGYGAWATDLLLHHRKYDTAISPIGYTYLAGGSALVLFVFFVFGILMKSLEFILKNIHGVIAFVLFLNLIKLMAVFDTVVWATFLNLIRYAILLPPLMWFIFRKWQIGK